MEVNATLHSEFIILGFYEWPHLHFTLFLILLLVYLMALTGNLIILVVIVSSSNLHTPMYFFLGNLSILDIILTSSVMPKLLDICLTENQSITYLGCFTQVLIFLICAVSEFFLLTVMAYDRYVAICYPLRYYYLIRLKICIQLAIISWGFGLLESLLLTGLTFRCSFTNSNIINHLLCNLESLQQLSSICTREAQMAASVLGFIGGFIPMTFIFVTYGLIIYSILKISSKKGKKKAFSTCSSHLMVITLFLAVIFRMYIRTNSDYSIQEDKILSIFYTCCIPALNPLIYSLRNNDVHVALQKLKLNIYVPVVKQWEHSCCNCTNFFMYGVRTIGLVHYR